MSLLHKENTDPKEIRNYRHISLLNVDYKIFASVLSMRLKKILPHIIQQDQTGFLPKRQLRSRIRTI